MSGNCPATLDEAGGVTAYLQAVPHETDRKVGQNVGVRIRIPDPDSQATHPRL